MATEKPKSSYEILGEILERQRLPTSKSTSETEAAGGGKPG